MPPRWLASVNQHIARFCVYCLQQHSRETCEKEASKSHMSHAALRQHEKALQQHARATWEKEAFNSYMPHAALRQQEKRSSATWPRSVGKGRLQFFTRIMLHCGSTKK